MGSMDRIKRKSEELKKKRQNPNYQVDNTMININDKVNTIKSGGRLYDDIAPVKTTKTTSKKKDENIIDKILGGAGYIAKELGTGILGGLSGIGEAGTTEVASNLKKGKDKNILESGLDLFDSIIKWNNPSGAILDNAVKSITKNVKDKDSTGLEKYVNTALDIASPELPADKVMQFYGSVLPDKSSDKVMDFGEIISSPYYNAREKLNEEKNQYGTVMQTAGTVSEVVGRMLPSIAASVLTKNPNVGLATMGVSAKGSATTEALNKGAELEKAVKIGDLKGQIEIGTEMLFGGLNVFGKGTLDDLVEKGIINKVKNEVGKKLATEGYKIGGEVIEETISDIAGTIIDKGTVDPNASYGIDDWGETALVTVLSTIVLNAITRGKAGGINIQEQQQQAVQQAEQELGRELTEQEKKQVEEYISNVSQQSIQQETEQNNTQNASNTEVNNDIAPIKEQNNQQKIQNLVQNEMISEENAQNNEKIVQNSQESKVKDIMYHGTRGDFTTFDNSKIGQNYNGGWSSLGKGFYFTNNYDSAKEFGKASINKGKVSVKEANLDIKNPFYVDNLSQNDNKTLNEIKTKYELGDISNGYELIDGLKRNGLDSTEVLKEAGYDGIISNDEVMVFDSNQIKIKTNDTTIQENAQKTENIVQNTPENNNKTENLVENKDFKSKQLEIIQKSNPMEDDYHTGIRSVDDIKTAQEVFTTENFEEVANPDFTYEMSQEALKNGKVKVYSSYPIEQGTFVSTSKMEAESYSSNGKVYEKTVDLNDIAWIENTQGQYAKVENKSTKNVSSKSENIQQTKENVQETKTATNKDGLKISVGDTIRTFNNSIYEVTDLFTTDDGVTRAKLKSDNYETSIGINAIEENLSQNKMSVKEDIAPVKEEKVQTLEQRVSGDDLLDAQDLIEEVKSVGANVDENGYVTVYHQTSAEAAAKIKQSGKMTANEDYVYFSTSKNASQSEGRGQAKLEFKIPAEKLLLDDIFSDNADVKVPLKGSKVLDVADYLVNQDLKETSIENGIAPIKQELADLTSELKETIKDTKKELKSLRQSVNDVKASVNEVMEESRALTEADIPMVEAQASESLNYLTDNDIAPIQENTTPEYEYENDPETIESPLEDRNIDEVGNRKIKAYQYENPEVRPYFKAEAEIMLGELGNTIRGKRIPIYDETGNMEYVGVTRETTDAIAYLRDNYNYTYDEIEKGLKAIIEDNGKENIAVAKRIEFLLDDRLRNGYKAIDGLPIPANQEYINFLKEKGITEYYRETFNTLTDEYAPQLTEEEIIARNKRLQEASIENATENHPPLTDEFIEELNKQSIEWARESGKLKENASYTQQVKEIAPVVEQTQEVAPIKEQVPKLKDITTEEKAAIDKANELFNKNPYRKTIAEEKAALEEKIKNDKYANNNVVLKKKTSLKDNIMKTWDAFQSHFVNRNRQIDKLSKSSGNNEIKFKGDRVNNIAGEIGGDIFTAQTDNYGNVIGKPLDAPFQAAREAGLDTYFDNYLKHQSNIERHTQGKGSKVVTTKMSKDYVKAYENKYPQFKAWAKDVYTYNQNLLNNAENNGLINNDFKNLLTNMYGHYVPFYENNQNTDPSLYMSIDEIKTSKPIKRATGGSDANLLGVEQAIMQQTYAYKNAIAKNDLYKEIGSVIKDKAKIGADVRTNPTSLADSLYADENGKYLTYYENGEQTSVKINDELYTELSRDLEKQIRNLEEKYSAITKPLQKVSQVRGQILTTYNIGFVVTNPFKDIQDALLNTKNFKGYVKNVLSASTIKDSVKGQNVNKYAEDFKALTGKDITTVKSESSLKGNAKSIYKDYQDGTMWNRFTTSYGSNAASMEFTDSGLDVKAKNKGFLNGIEKANNYMEVMFRYPEFKATLERGGSFTEALYNAREVTTNFGRGGTISKAINRNGATFFNTSVQGMDKFFRNFSGENGARGFVGAVSKAVTVGMIPAILNHLLFGDDDEYEALPNYVKDNYYLFKTSDGEFIRIPKGRMISVLGSAARRTLELADGNEDAFEGFLKNTSDQIVANNPLKENIFSPIVQAVKNEAWYGGDLVPTRLQNKPAAEQFDESTDEFSKWLGEQLNISPYKINYVLDQYSGGFGDLILPMITEEAKSDGTLLAPLKDKFTANSTDDNKYVGELYDTSEELTIKANASNATEEDILRNKYMNSIKADMGKLYQEKREIQNSDLSKKEKYEKVKAIQDVINSMAKEGLDSYKDIEMTDNYSRVGDKEYFKTTKGEWYSIDEDEATDLNAMGMTATEKNKYFSAKNSIYSIKGKYEDLLDNSTEDEKDSLYTDQKREIIDEIIGANLDDEGMAYLYDKYYANTNKLNVVLNTNIPFETYLGLEYQNFTADKDEYGKSISGSKKKKIMDYIESTGLDYGEKIVLHKIYYPADDSYNYEIADYVFNNVPAYEDRINILETLGFIIGEDGVVYWD